ncbi:MAG: serine hydrolase [Lachnospiraceae bacterium]|nr:serine hydrolase [Lachnospiraceae bacterium]
MKGFRDLDPEEAEQVVTSRRRRKEYIDDLEAQLYAPLMSTGYDAQPSERRSGTQRTPRATFYDVSGAQDGSDFTERVYEQPEERYDRPQRPVRPAERYEEEEEFYERPRRSMRPAERYEEDEEFYDRSRRPMRSAERYEEKEAFYERPRRPMRRPAERYAEEEEFYERPRRPMRPAERYEEEEEYYRDAAEEDYDPEDDDADDGYAYVQSRGPAGCRRRAAHYARRAFLIAGILFVLTVGGIIVFFGHAKKENRQARGEEKTAQQGANDGELWELTGEEAVMWNGGSETAEEEVVEETSSAFLAPSAEKDVFFEGYRTYKSDETKEIVDEEVQSTYGVLINAETGEVIAEKQADAITSPASMTKILTLLVAVEHLADLDEKVVMTQEIGDTVYRKDLSAVGYQVGDEIPVRDLLYGTILPSGADAAMLLAEHVAGSQEAFVEMMNDRVQELGIAETAHFSNVVGNYDTDNHCTMRDMAMILKAAVENDLCREVLNTRIYTTSPTPDHPEGIEISNWFLRRIEDKDAHGEVVCAKTGFVDQSGCCAASYQISNDGGHYLCVTGDAWSSWRCIYDHVRIYDLYTN